jgi:REP element-mobilizing transposase RayT
MASKTENSRHLAHVPSFHDNPLVFFTVTVHERRRVLACSAAHRVLDDIWRKSASKNGWFVGDYLLMPDHVHFFARPAASAQSMEKWVGMWKSLSARILSKEAGFACPLWQEDYFDRYLRSGESYKDEWTYVAQNPVRANLVTDAEEWPFRGRIHDLGW